MLECILNRFWNLKISWFYMFFVDFRWIFKDFGPGLILYQIANLKGSTLWLFSVPETTLQCVLSREVMRKHCRNMLECILNSFRKFYFPWFFMIFAKFSRISGGHLRSELGQPILGSEPFGIWGAIAELQSGVTLWPGGVRQSSWAFSAVVFCDKHHAHTCRNVWWWKILYIWMFKSVCRICRS